MQPIASHAVLVTAPSLEKACIQVKDFFRNTMLVRYDRIEIIQAECYSAETQSFHKAVHLGIKKNRKTLERFIHEFKNTGFKSVGDLHNVECGYPSKMLHIITHFLDGFIGIDSSFYNLHEDSHWISDNTRSEIETKPRDYWIITLNCFSESPEKVSLVQT